MLTTSIASSPPRKHYLNRYQLSLSDSHRLILIAARLPLALSLCSVSYINYFQKSNVHRVGHKVASAWLIEQLWGATASIATTNLHFLSLQRRGDWICDLLTCDRYGRRDYFNLHFATLFITCAFNTIILNATSLNIQ